MIAIEALSKRAAVLDDGVLVLVWREDHRARDPNRECVVCRYVHEVVERGFDTPRRKRAA